jgi:hypothetical protein
MKEIDTILNCCWCLLYFFRVLVMRHYWLIHLGPADFECDLSNLWICFLSAEVTASAAAHITK